MQRLSILSLAAAFCIAATTVSGAPERRTAAAEYVTIDTRQLATMVADTARRCWINREPAFAGFVVDRVEQGAEATTFRVLFREKGRAKSQPARHLKILTGKSGSLVMIAVEQEGVDVLGPVRRDAAALIRGRAPAC
ncbi:hypothetical protein [Enterovirga rhinocerotis]|uniref:Uncharacterized protein n=1 Tax=Enterovirga rhinocerotis TaxID=1339210 RepID=A0A4R7BNE2_9HYPH|nr:hypothetical protein [Enterovirga rhinocerotis]TDR85447.1 hypothetical protein EV668_4569 [Enterovirga rhinocerotis]